MSADGHGRRLGLAPGVGEPASRAAAVRRPSACSQLLNWLLGVTAQTASSGQGGWLHAGSGWRVVQQLLTDWHYAEPTKPHSSLLPVRSTCRAWRAVVDADISHVALTVPPIAPEHLAVNFPHVTSLDLSRYQHSCQEVFPVMQQLKLRSLVLADPWDPPVSLPTQFLTQLTHLSFLAEGLLVPHLAAQFCAALSQLQQLRQLALCRLQLSAQAAQQLAQALTELPHLEHLALSGGAAPVSTAELYVLLNVELPGLRSLELTRLGARMLPLSLTRLAGLTRLTFSGEMVRNLPLSDELRQLSNLQVLDLSANLAEQLPVGVLELSGLRELHAGMNRLGVHTHSFRRLEELQVLVLASNKLVGVHSSLWGLTSLVRLDLGHNNLTELPQEVSQLTGLTFLSVCHNFLTALPAGLSNLVNLVDLDVSLNTDMRELPQGLGQLSCMTRLVASHMRLKQLPMDVGGLVSLLHLDVSHNSLHHLSPALSCLVELTHLEASDNKLHQSAAVPEELASLTALRVLRLARNRLQTLPEALGCYGRLQVLDCSGNRLTSVPRVVGRCTALQQLLMASNRLRGLTSGIGNLVRLQVLDLSHNQYRHLPTMTGDLTQLQSLLLEENQLEDLPSSCSALIKLTALTLNSNRLHVLPPAISRMSGLLTLTLEDNPLLGRDVVVLQLQRQLPALKVDHLPPLQGMGSQAQQLSSLKPLLSRAAEPAERAVQQAGTWAPAGAAEGPMAGLAASSASEADEAGAGSESAAAGSSLAGPAARSVVPLWLRQMQQQGGASSSSGSSGIHASTSLAQMLQALAENAAQEAHPQGRLARILGEQLTADANEALEDAAIAAAAAAPLLQAGSEPLPRAPALAAGTSSALADRAGSSAAAAADGAAGLSGGARPAWLLGGLAGVLGNAGTPCPWQRLLAVQPQGGQQGSAVQQIRAAAVAAATERLASFGAGSSSAAQQRQHAGRRPVQLDQQLNQQAGGAEDSAAAAAAAARRSYQGHLLEHQQQTGTVGCSSQTHKPGEEDDSEEGVSLACTSSHMGSIDGGYMSSLDGGNGSAGCGVGANTVAAAAAGLSALHLHGETSSIGGAGAAAGAAAAGGSSNLAARVKSYLEVATSSTLSSNNSSSGGGPGASLSRQGSLGLPVRASDAGSNGQVCCQQQQQQHRQGMLYRVGSAGSSGAGVMPSASLYVDGASHTSGHEAAAGTSAAAAAGSSAAAMPCGEADEVCSAGGMESCGSEDSGSEVLLRLGTPQPSTQTAYSHGGEQLLAAGAGGVAFNSRCPSSNGSGVVGNGSAAALGNAGLSAAVSEVDDARDADAESCTTNGDDVESSVEPGNGQQEQREQQVSLHAQLAAGHVDSWQQEQAQQHQRQPGSGDRSFAHVLESAWWGRRRG